MGAVALHDGAGFVQNRIGLAEDKIVSIVSPAGLVAGPPGAAAPLLKQPAHLVVVCIVGIALLLHVLPAIAIPLLQHFIRHIIAGIVGI